MLVLSRKLNETIIIDRDIRITVVGLRGKQVRLGIEAPASVPIFRRELWDSVGVGEVRAAPASADAAGNPALD